MLLFFLKDFKDDKKGVEKKKENISNYTIFEDVKADVSDNIESYSVLMLKEMSRGLISAAKNMKAQDEYYLLNY